MIKFIIITFVYVSCLCCMLWTMVFFLAFETLPNLHGWQKLGIFGTIEIVIVAFLLVFSIHLHAQEKNND